MESVTGATETHHLGSFVAAQQVMLPSNLAPGKKTGGHYFGNHLDEVCQNPLTP